MKSIDANTTSLYPTHFLRGVELIYKGMEEYGIPSENWPHPTRYKFGSPCERYYAEIWINGMDWQPTYWVIEEKNFENPQVYPFIVFDENKHRELFCDYDFDQLIRGSLHYRQDKFWVKHDDYGVATDLVWPFIKGNGYMLKFNTMKRYSVEHASQRYVEFWMNYEFIPEEYRDQQWKDYWNNRHKTSGYISCLSCHNQ